MLTDMSNDLTDNGFDRPELNDVSNYVKQLFINRFGSSIDMDDTSTAGMFAGVLSDLGDKLSEVLQGAINQCFVLSASGSGLDDQGAEWGLQRKQATHSFVDLTITAYVDPNSPTVFPGVDTKFSTADGYQFALTDDVTISQQATDSNGKPLTDDDGNALGQATVQAMSVDAGADQNVAAHSIVNSLQAIDGFYSVDNDFAAQGGSEAEGDVPFRIRIYNYRTAGPKFTDNGITAELRNLPDVQDTKLIDNNTLQTDKYGNQPKSIHLYVLGGDDNEIAQKYFDLLYPTTNTDGSITESVISDDGIKHQVSFDHAKSVNTYINLDLTVDLSKFNEDQAVSDIKNSIEQYYSNMKMGDTVLYSRLFGPCYKEDGVNDVRVTLGTDPNNLATNDIHVTDFERAEIDPDNISINITGGDQ